MKIALLGYGKMGKEIEQIALLRGHSISLKLDEHNAANDISRELAGSDVAIEFSTPHTAVGNIKKCFDAKVPVVVGTTGWLDQLPEITARCTKESQGLFWASNFSVGVNIFFRVNEYLAQMMNAQSGYDVRMEEVHHIHKKDAPSGTAITLAEGILKNFHTKKNWVNTKEGKPDELPILSVREDEVPGTHIVNYYSEVDDIEIIHTAHSRKGFALGAVLAAEWMAGRKGVYGMKDLLGF